MGYNEVLVRRGEILLDMDLIDSWSGEFARMNEEIIQYSMLPSILAANFRRVA